MLPQILIICGSGLGGLAKTLESPTKEFAYSEIPNFVESTVAGHAGKLVFGKLSGVPAVCMVGRFHFYEGHRLEQTVLPVRVAKLLGVEILIGERWPRRHRNIAVVGSAILAPTKWIANQQWDLRRRNRGWFCQFYPLLPANTMEVTNAAGGLNPEYQVGDVMIMNDHLSIAGLAGQNPLVGPNIESMGPRFPAISDAYDFELRKFCYRTARAVGMPRAILREGVYAMVAGPSYESKAEARFLRSIGADVVGMSTVPEVIAARHCGLRVLGLSLVTNRVLMHVEPCADEEMKIEAAPYAAPAHHEEVLAASAARSREMQAFVAALVAEIKKIM
ncbi:MAG: nucleoside phosphorylase domain-containing protein [Olpidium bornovanus]|uniref:purine-nucleoside phosphorylase n=1 Tax=Olpidium bornovanus TaxID=278681 RepID=A0A8H8DJN0_9FUNG|nr:MAG: nucleoside phosphorylase domain-containing protein [Olpidium bornovanus]